MPRTPKTTGPRKLPHRYPNEELWSVSGHDGRTNFVTGVIVSNGVVKSVPNLLAWMTGQEWLWCAQKCEERGWLISQVDPERAMRSMRQERDRNTRGVVQTALDLGPRTT